MTPRPHRNLWIHLIAWPLLVSSALLGAKRQSERIYENEAEAVAEGRKLGIGYAVLDGPARVEVLTHQTWTLAYTAGKAGIQPGGGIRVTMRHIHCWSPPQTKDPTAEGYLTVKTPDGVAAQVAAQPKPDPPFTQYFPWQNMVQVKIPEKELAPGETIQITYGDHSGGSPGMRVQPFDESRFVFKCFVDARGDGDYLPLAEHPSIEIVAAEPYRLNVIMPSDALVGRPTWCVVRAEDRYGNPSSRYRGTIRWQATDPSAELPPAYTFTDADRGAHRFEDLTLTTAGDHTVQVSDGKFQATGNPVRAAREQPKRLLLWGDIHGHTLYSDGRGTVEEYYDFARRVAGLDFCSVTDHAFEILDDMWAHSKAVTNRLYEPGHFVTFQAFEWSGKTDVGGDHNVYFLENDPPIYRSTSYYDRRNFQMYHGPTAKEPHITDVFAKLAEQLRDRDVFTIPHYGGRRGNPKWHDPRVQRMVEIFSEHRRSEDWASTFLKQGYRMGIMASTDGHFGNPGYGYLKPTYDWGTQEIGMAAVAVYAAERTRESVFRALYDRRVYATSGDRIILDVQADGHAMGSEYKTTSPPTLEIEAVGTAPFARIEIKKDSEIVHVVEPGQTSVRLQWRDPDFRPDGTCYYYVRVVQNDNEEAISSPIWIN